LGIYNIYLNGKKVGGHILAPEWTDYFKRVQYQTNDVTRLINASQNVIGASLADGWYAGTMFNHPNRGNYGFDRRLIAQLQIEYMDGSSDIIATDGSWKILKEGPIREVSIFDGEVFDENMNPSNWLQPGFNDDCWTPVTVDTSVSIILNAQMNEPIKVIRELKPVSVFEVNKETYIFDMGQNMVGWATLSLSYNPGKKIILRYGEMLNPDSTLYTENLRGAKQTDIYIPGKSDDLYFEPKFTYHGFRYVEITGLTKKPELGNALGEVIASGAPVSSWMETSDKELNKLWENILWTQLGNIYGVPTDCPQRDERAGWMGDAQVFCQTAMYNMDMAAFYTKWFRDIRDAQTENGRFPNYAPQAGMRYYDAPGWADAGVIIPWKFYETYGDKRTLSTQYEAMCKFIDFVYDKNPKLIRVNAVGDNYGDWLNGNTIKASDYPKEGGAVPKDVFNTAYFAYSTQLVANASKVLGEKVKYRHYDSLAKAIRKVFVIQFMDKNGVIKGNTQAGYAIALAFDLVPEKLKTTVAKHMLDAVTAYDYRLSTGIHSTARLMNELSKYGYTDVAYRLLQSHRFPSWFYSIDQGATTIWERWDGYVKGRGFQDPGMNSFNHYAIGSVGEWLYKHILGINPDEENPGYHHFIIQPQPGGSLTWAKGAYHSIMGEISVSWRKDDMGFTLDLEIPVNTTATVILPPGKIVQESGSPVGKIKNIKEIGVVRSASRLLVPSGHYSFLVTD
jgi:alpha-L-rhamnosidase